jgi:hypothetical protein
MRIRVRAAARPRQRRSALSDAAPGQAHRAGRAPSDIEALLRALLRAGRGGLLPETARQRAHTCASCCAARCRRASQVRHASHAQWWPPSRPSRRARSSCVALNLASKHADRPTPQPSECLHGSGPRVSAPRTCSRHRATWSKYPASPCGNPSTAANLGLSRVPATFRLRLLRCQPRNSPRATVVSLASSASALDVTAGPWTTRSTCSDCVLWHVLSQLTCCRDAPTELQ